jgi:hypothetical protein
MRIKTSFVTNSSSSSFMVVWANKIKKLEDILQYIPEKDKAEQVFKDSKQFQPFLINPNDKKIIRVISEEMTHGFMNEIESQLNAGAKRNSYDYDGYDNFKEKFIIRHRITKDDLKEDHYTSNLIWEEYENYRLALAEKLAIKFCKENEGSFLYIYEYGDESGSFFSEMEHGGTFKNVRHIQISKH